MSQEGLDLVLRAYRAATRRPKPDYETVNALYAPDHVFVSVLGGELGEGEAKGGEGYRAWLKSQMDVMPFETDVEGAVDIAPDVVLAVATTRAQGASSGLENEQRMWSVVHLAGGKITRTEVYIDPVKALAATGLLAS
jgi:ketosteroid isomerase-like protein